MNRRRFALPPRTSRPLTGAEAGALLAADLVGFFGAIDDAELPHFTKVRFIWDGEAVVMSALEHTPHLAGLADHQLAGFMVHVDDGDERADGQRPSRQVRATGRAELVMDHDGAWSRRIDAKYEKGPPAADVADARMGRPRVVIRLVPTKWVGVAVL